MPETLMSAISGRLLSSILGQVRCTERMTSIGAGGRMVLVPTSGIHARENGSAQSVPCSEMVRLTAACTVAKICLIERVVSFLAIRKSRSRPASACFESLLAGVTRQSTTYPRWRSDRH